MLEAFEVRSSSLKLMIMITHIKGCKYPILTYGQFFSQRVPHTSYSSHFFGMFKYMLASYSSNIVLEETNLTPITYCLFS